jgi:hypothetical protein
MTVFVTYFIINTTIQSGNGSGYLDFKRLHDGQGFIAVDMAVDSCCTLHCYALHNNKIYLHAFSLSAQFSHFIINQHSACLFLTQNPEEQYCLLDFLAGC